MDKWIKKYWYANSGQYSSQHSHQCTSPEKIVGTERIFIKPSYTNTAKTHLPHPWTGACHCYPSQKSQSSRGGTCHRCTEKTWESWPGTRWDSGNCRSWCPSTQLCTSCLRSVYNKIMRWNCKQCACYNLSWKKTVNSTCTYRKYGVFTASLTGGRYIATVRPPTHIIGA